MAGIARKNVSSSLRYGALGLASLLAVQFIFGAFTAGLDAEANVIWGARIDDEMRGKLRVMTIITGVRSPYVLGQNRLSRTPVNTVRVDNELGLDMLS